MRPAYMVAFSLLAGLTGFLVGLVADTKQPETVYVPQVRVQYVDRPTDRPTLPIIGETATVTKEHEPIARPFSCVVGRWLN